MDRLPRHCQENAYFFKMQDYADIDMKTNGIKTSFKFNKIPDIYTINDEKCFAAEMLVNGLKVGAAALVKENVLNIKMHQDEGSRQIRNFNFLLPSEISARDVSVEVFDGNTIVLRAPLKNTS